jgi:hypothetical protein
MIAKVAAASSATAAVAGAEWIVTGPHDSKIICAGANSILRAVGAAQGCAPEQIRLEIAQMAGGASGPACDCDPWNPQKRNDHDSAQSIEDALAQDTERLRHAENSAEFTVVDRLGHSLLGRP